MRKLLSSELGFSRDHRRLNLLRHGHFVEIYLSTPLAVCESRDPKGLYARARAGTLHHMTRVDDPCESPQRPDLALDSSRFTVDELVSQVVDYLGEKQLLGVR